MIFRNNNSIDDDDDFSSKKKTTKKKEIVTESNDIKEIDLTNFKKIGIIILGILFAIILLVLLSKLFSGKKVSYDDNLYYITLLGDKNMTVYVGEEYIEPGYRGEDEKGRNLTSSVAVSGEVNNNTIGEYKIYYTLGNITKERIVKVTERPIGATYIHLNGDVNIFLYVGESYVEKGYQVIDSVDGAKLNDKVSVSSDVDTSKVGIYKVIYSVVNSSGVTTSATRTVIVTERDFNLISTNEDITNGNVTINVYIRDEMFSYLVLPNNVKKSDRVTSYDVSSNGTYKFIMYNTKGEAKEKSITINNIDRESPSGSCSGYYQNGTSQVTVNAKDNVGISRYVINGTSYTVSNIKLNSEMKQVNVTIYDKAGNSKTISCNLTNKNGNTTTTKVTTTKSGGTTTTTKATTTTKPAGTLLNVPAGTNVRKDYDSEMSYVEVMPSNATTNMPVVIYLDGAWSYASFPDNVLSRSITKYVKDGSAYKETGENFLYISPRYVISDGKNGGLNWWGSHGPREAKKIKGLIDHLYKKYQIDKSRVYVTGVSLGGDGVFYLINAYPTTFAAGTAVSGCPFNASASNFKTTPLLGYNGTGATENRAGYKTCVPNMVSKIKSAGGIAESRVKSGWDHGNMINVYSTDKDVFKWMFKYKRS